MTLNTKSSFAVIVLPIIEWSHRYQRPQHIASGFAADGHRVFYTGLTFSGWENQLHVELVRENIWRVDLPGPADHNRFLQVLPDPAVELCCNAILKLAQDFEIDQAIILIQQPFWARLAKQLENATGWKIVYDCMDEHAGLTALNDDIINDEALLGASSDLVITSSRKLYEKHEKLAKRHLMLPNAGEYAHFSSPGEGPNPLEGLQGPIIGYYGAIMEWFDVDMILQAAQFRPDWSFVLIGQIDTDAVEPLRHFANIHFLGEKPYKELPAYLHRFDVAIIPFKLIPIIQATNPVKFYEYLSAGKPVVASPMPELEPLSDLHYTATTGAELVIQAERAISENSHSKIEHRRTWAQGQTWAARYSLLKENVMQLWGKISIVIVSYQNLEKIRDCVESIVRYTDYPNYEVLIVENGSDEPVVAFLMAFVAEHPAFKLIDAGENLGFSKGNNLGLKALDDESQYVVLLNNDTVVTRGWLSGLVKWLGDPTIGMVGPVTWPSGSANETAVPVSYTDPDGMHEFAFKYMHDHRGRSFDLPMLAMFCVAMRKSIIQTVGLLDENYGVGMFEDDDYSLRVRNAGFRIVCAQDVFIHHIGRSSFGSLDEKIYNEIFEVNKNYYENKWGVKWRHPENRPIFEAFKLPENSSYIPTLPVVQDLTTARVSVVLVNFNGKEHLDPCLKSLMALDYEQSQLEIILVDNASQDDSVAWLGLHWPAVKIIPNTENVGFSRGCNQGALVATGDFIAFLNNDMRVDRLWLAELIKPFAFDAKIACVGSMIFNWEGSAVEFAGRYDDVFSIAFEPLPQTFRPEYVADAYSIFVSGGAILVRKTIFLEKGGFDPRYFMYHEDVDLCWRLWVSGHRCYIAPRSMVYHRGGASSKKLENKVVSGWAQKHLLWTAIKNFDDQNLKEYLPVLIYFLIQRGQWSEVSMKALVDGIEETQAALSSILYSRHLIQNSRQTSDEAIFDFVGHPMAFILRSPLFNAMGTELRSKYSPADLDLTDPGQLAHAMTEWFKGSVALREHYREVWQAEAVWKANRPTTFTTQAPPEIDVDVASFYRAESESSRTTQVPLEIDRGVVPFFKPEPGSSRRLKLIKRILREIQNICNRVLTKANLPTLSRQTIENVKASARRVASPITELLNDSGDQRVTLVVVTFNNIEYTRACLYSIDQHTDYPALEIIVVDNASDDGTREFLSEWVNAAPNRQIILNEENLGFAAANNQGLAAASGDFLVLLNNDTYVTPRWVCTLIDHLKLDSSIGLIGPVTNNIGNEAKINIEYANIEDMLKESSTYTQNNTGVTLPLRTAAFFCVMMPREIYEKIGPLDEAFGLGFFEDDDYCRRVEQLGKRIVCAEDVFIHHHLSASFSKLNSQVKQELFEKNKVIYETKWGEWIPHGYRENQQTAIPDRSVPDIFDGQRCIIGQCNVCGKQTRFFYQEVALWRESLNCEHCRTTSRYRSISRGVLRAIRELTANEAPSLAALPRDGKVNLHVYDTQPPFYYDPCAYPLPDLLKATGWITVELSQYKPKQAMGQVLTKGVTNQNLECLTFADASLDIVITSDVMEHVRLDDRAHSEIYRVLKPGGIYIFTVPHDRAWDETLIRVQIIDPDDPSKDVHLLEPEYHGDANSDEDSGVLAYRRYGRDVETHLNELGFEVEYFLEDIKHLGILTTELYYCRKMAS